MEVHHGALGMRLHCINFVEQYKMAEYFRHFTTKKKAKPLPKSIARTAKVPLER